MAATRRLAAILAADVAGYSRLMGVDEEGTLAALKAIRAELSDPKIAEHNGRIVKTIVGGLLVKFASVVDALHCVARSKFNVAARLEGLVEAGGIHVSAPVLVRLPGSLTSVGTVTIFSPCSRPPSGSDRPGHGRARCTAPRSRPSLARQIVAPW